MLEIKLMMPLNVKLFKLKDLVSKANIFLVLNITSFSIDNKF